ncbi:MULTISPECIES: hypothetical protein [Paenibacillus]|jgi:hypothetical protein|uniref:Uncharacterized protein n=1 Tax=Paenibacillus odorifer TaxID=189426 RepID=A0A1R0WTS3_9BACL|nr:MULTISPECIES: hypothetical protein [Paenibacillus]AIQ77067.1 hypothetical protein PODO_29725 [Paenibacillus odorifer]AWV36343.1 hypothetical protein CD191_29135 [Paenibacillus odorifer]MDH6428931.1 hypothetical protein [Paenibacillus sp. PastH-4]MDH6445133.1 hypothetical protein [Paenibacillus sp. PastF-4]MDH6529026.1 hypothetical protein [Paenibacillus sp. PastH-3]
MKQPDSSLQANDNVTQAKNSLGKLHFSVSQALSHPTEQTLAQAENRLAHTEQAIQQAQDWLGPQGVELAEELLTEDKSRLASLNKQGKRSER